MTLVCLVIYDILVYLVIYEARATFDQLTSDKNQLSTEELVSVIYHQVY